MPRVEMREVLGEGEVMARVKYSIDSIVSILYMIVAKMILFQINLFSDESLEASIFLRSINNQIGSKVVRPPDPPLQGH